MIRKIWGGFLVFIYLFGLMILFIGLNYFFCMLVLQILTIAAYVNLSLPYPTEYSILFKIYMFVPIVLKKKTVFCLSESFSLKLRYQGIKTLTCEFT